MEIHMIQKAFDQKIFHRALMLGGHVSSKPVNTTIRSSEHSKINSEQQIQDSLLIHQYILAK